MVPFLMFAQSRKEKKAMKKEAENGIAVIDSSAIKDSLAMVAHADSLSKVAVADSVRKDSIALVAKADSAAAKKNCYTEWYDAFRARGGKPVTDGMQEVIIALRTPESCKCFLGQVEVEGGKIKPPLYFKQEDGQFRLVSITGKKLEPAFAESMTPDELYGIKDGMSITFRTSDQEYGRLFFYKFANKSAQSNKEAPSPTDLIKD